MANMTIIQQSSDSLTKLDKYTLMMSPEIQKMRDVPPEEVLDCVKWIQYEDTKKDGEKQTILSIQTNDGVFATNSPTFQQDFEAILDIMDGEPFKFSVIRGVSKAEREFITIALRT